MASSVSYPDVFCPSANLRVGTFRYCSAIHGISKRGSSIVKMARFASRAATAHSGRLPVSLARHAEKHYQPARRYRFESSENRLERLGV